MEITLDKFLDGRINIYQPKKGYRAGIDAVILAACIKEKKNCKILDAGSGSGLISFCLAHRCKNVFITGIEKNKEYHFLAMKSLKKNKLKSEINFLNKNFKDLHNMKFHIIVSNPPWFPRNTTFQSKNLLINDSKIESLNLDFWINKVFSNLTSLGEYYTIFPYNRIKVLIKILKKYFNIIKVYPLASFKGLSANKAIVYAKKSNNKYKYCEFDNIIIHKSDKTFKSNINAILRKGNPLSLS